MGTTEPQDDPGGLFDTQGGMLDQAAARETAELQAEVDGDAEWRVVKTADPDPANRFKVMRRKGYNQKDTCPTCSTTRTP